MEETYSFQQKQEALQYLLKKKIKRSFIKSVFNNIEIKKNSETCLNCNIELTEKTPLFCSYFCNQIYESNLKIKLIKYKKKNKLCPPFELFTKDSQIKFSTFIKEIKNINYDKFNCYYNIGVKFNSDYNVFIKNIIFSIDLILNYKTIAKKTIELDLIIFKLNDLEKYSSLNFINKNNLKQNTKNNQLNYFDKLLDNKCIYCHEENKNLYYIDLGNKFIIGKVCSIFCYKAFVTNNERHLNYEYKHFINIPPISFFNNISDLKKIKSENLNDKAIYDTEEINNTLSIYKYLYK